MRFAFSLLGILIAMAAIGTPAHADGVGVLFTMVASAVPPIAASTTTYVPPQPGRHRHNRPYPY